MVNIYKQELTNLQQEIVRLFCIRAGESLNQRQIANLLGVSPPAVMKALPDIEKEGFVRIDKDKESGRLVIRLNRDNQNVMRVKRVDNLRLIFESGLLDYLEVQLAGATIILFGSYSKGEDMYNSDIDLAVIGRRDKILYLEKFEEVLKRKINVNFYESWGKISKHLKNNILNGIVLIGGVEL